MKLDRSTWRALAVGAQIGTSIVASLGLAMGGGYLLDRWLGTKPIFLLLGIVVGIVAAAYTLVDMARQFDGTGAQQRKED